MADTTIDQISKLSSSSDDLKKKLDQISKAKTNALKQNDTTLLTSLMKVEKQYQKLLTVTEQYGKEVENIHKKGVKASTEEMEQLAKAADAHAEATDNIKKMGAAQANAYKNAKQQVQEYNANLLKSWQNHSKVGQAVGLLSSSVVQLAGGLTLLRVAGKAWTAQVEAAELRQNMLIQSNRLLDQTSPGRVGGIFDRGVAVLKDTFGELEKYSAALQGAKSVAERMGVSTDVASDTMLRFQKITGVNTPEALGKLTSGTIAVSRAMGITVPEAVDFVSTRMEKFGGSAAGAIISLEKLRRESSSFNNMIGRTVVRSDDLVKSLMDISRQTNMYAIDQRYVGGILRENVSRLQAMGDSYDTALKKAQMFTKAVTGDVPDWMRIYAGTDVLNTLQSNFVKAGKDSSGAFTQSFIDQYGAEIEAAKPGLLNELKDIMGSNMAYFDKINLVQQLTRGLSMGMEATNKQILKLAKTAGGLSIIARDMTGGDYVMAQGLAKQADEYMKKVNNINKLAKITNAEQLKNIALKESGLKLSDDMAKEIVSKDKESDRKKALNEIIGLEQEINTVMLDRDRIQREDLARKAEIEKIDKRIKNIKAKKADAIFNLFSTKDEGKIEKLKKDIEIYNRMEKAAEDERSKAAPKDILTDEQRKKKIKEGKGDDLTTVEDLTNAHLNSFNKYSDETGQSWKAALTRLSTIEFLLGALGGGALFKFLNAKFGVWDKIKSSLAGNYAKKLIGAGEMVGASTGATAAASTTGGIAGAAKGAADAAKGAKSAGMFSKMLSAVKSSNALSAVKTPIAAVGRIASPFIKLGSTVLRFLNPIGKLLMAWEGGVLVGEGFNFVLNKLAKVFPNTIGKFAAGLDKMRDAISDWLNSIIKNETIRKFLGIDVPDNKKQQKFADAKLVNSMVKAYGISDKKARALKEEADKKGTSVIELAKSKNIRRLNLSASDSSMKKMQKEQTSALASVMKKPVINTIPEKTNILTNAKMAAPTRQDNKQQPAATDEATLPQTTASNETMDQSGTAAGSFVGGINGDGSITLKVDNFMNVFAGAMGQMKSKTMRPSSVA